MLGNSWHKKEKPLLGLAGLAGGVVSNLVGGASDPEGMTATGGIISDYTDAEDGNAYRAHIFTRDAVIGAPQSFVISSLSPEGDKDKIDYLVIGGGGGGGKEAYPTNLGAGGGGAGLLRYKAELSVPTPAGATTYPVAVGRGGQGGGSPYPEAANVNGQDGTTSTFTIPWGTPAACPGGGGGGGHADSPPWGGSAPGGSGGGGRVGTPGSAGTGAS